MNLYFKACSAHGLGVQMPKLKVNGSGFPDPAIGNGQTGVPITTTLRTRTACILIDRMLGPIQDAPGRGDSYVNCNWGPKFQDSKSQIILISTLYFPT